MIKLGNLVNEESLTIFTDASISPNRDGTYYGCPGFVAVDANGIIDSGYIVIDDTTSNNSEIKAIRMGVMAANKYKEKYKYIRLFSDSQLCIFGLRDRFYSWFDNIYKAIGAIENSGAKVSEKQAGSPMQLVFNIKLDKA